MSKQDEDDDVVVTGIRSIRNLVDHNSSSPELLDQDDEHHDGENNICSLCKKSLTPKAKIKSDPTRSIRPPKKRNNDVTRNIELVLKSILETKVDDGKMNNINLIML